MDFTCTNKECSKYGEIVFIHKVKLQMVNGAFKPVLNILCPECNNLLSLIDKVSENGDIHVSIGRFNSMDNAQKKETIKKRAKRNYDTFHKRERENRRREMVKQIKKDFEDK